ncbi:MAG: outer membrane protein assembly factor BamA [Puniceicoccales bacterium]|jgi:outer membrane protein insertion porin family|nr:outer membrane protein assembly factor BamA [Puniceicoccales bacterium]
MMVAQGNGATADAKLSLGFSWRFIYVIFFAVCGSLSQPLLASGQEPVIGEVSVRSVGPMPINRDAISSLVKVREGEPFRQEANDDSIRALYATKLFDLVEVRTDGPAENGKISISYVLYGKARVGKISFAGNRKFSGRKLMRVVAIGGGSSLDWAQVKKDESAIRKLYVDGGHADVTVSAKTIGGEGEDAPVDLVFEIDEGRRLPIGKVNFSGNGSIGSRKLRSVLTTKRRSPLSFLNGSGYYRDWQMVADLEKLRNFYRNCGFLDVAIGDDAVILDRGNGKRLAVTIPVDEGQRFLVGNITFSGNKLHDECALRKRLRIAAGDYFSPDRVDESANAIGQLYGMDGHIDTSVVAQRRANLADNSIDINFAIVESAPCRVGAVHIEGNVKSKNNVILRELSLSPGDRFNLLRLRNSENRLRETRYFSRVAIIPEYAGEPDMRDVLVTVDEAKTGKFYVGGAMSSVDNLTAFVELGQSNFDVANPHGAFMGAGQKFRSRIEVGTRSSQFTTLFEEPWLFDRELTFGVDMFFWRNEHKRDDYNYSGSSYDERHGGVELYFRKRIVELLEGKLFYRIDRTKIYGVGAMAPGALREQERAGSQWISKVGFGVERDSRDSLLYPTVGNKFCFEIDCAGIWGDVHYLNLDLQAGQWFPLFKFLDQTVCFIAKAGAMKGFRGDSIPYFDRKFLGGPNDMRGFDVQAVGPRDRMGMPVGARTYAYGCGEYCFKLTDQFRLVLFSDCAYVGRKFCRLESPFYVDAGAELRIFVMGSPLRLIFGYPIRGDQYRERHMNFNFTFGTIF